MVTSCPQCGQMMLPMADVSEGLCSACLRRKPAKKAAPDPLKAHAHPNALAVMKEPFLWSADDGMSPLGTPSGREMLEALRAWRRENPLLPVEECLADVLRRGNIADEHWERVDPGDVERAVKWDLFDLIGRDDAALAIAFAQLVTEGRVDEPVKRRALFALQRGLLDSVVTARAWRDAAEWKRRARVMMDVLLKSA